MSTDERERHELYQRLEAAIGAGPADTLMAHLPPVGRADVATKSDLDALRRYTDARFGAMEDRMQRLIGELRADVRVELADGLRRHTWVTVATMVMLVLSVLGIGQIG